MPLDPTWTRLRDTRIGRLATHVYGINAPLRRYHTWTHVERLYHHAQHTFGFPYHLQLDLAIMWHDAVYDSLPQKELRSADLWMQVYDTAPLAGIDRLGAVCVHRLIMATAYHEVMTDDPLEEQLILLDLADLMNPEQTKINYDLIEQESMLLYGITRDQAAQGTVGFMSGEYGLRKRIESNAKRSTRYGEHWAAIINGINETIEIAKTRC